MNREDAMSSWDVPVALCWNVRRHDVSAVTELKCGGRKMVIPFAVGERAEIARRTEMWG